MIQNNRIIVDDGGTLTDRSVVLNSIKTQSLTLTNGNTIKFYVGSDWRFGHRYFLVGTANTGSVSLSVDLWDGSAWTPAVDIMDQTVVSGKSLAQSGVLSWAIDRNEGWQRAETTEDVEDLESFKIYKKFWARINLTGTPASSCAIGYMGYRFSEDTDLAIEYPELLRSNLLSQFDPNNSLKADWNDQHLAAADLIIAELKKDDTIISEAQILDWESLKYASVHRVAMMIFSNLGKDYTEDFVAAKVEYQSRIKRLNSFNVDRDLDGRLDVEERRPFIGIVRR